MLLMGYARYNTRRPIPPGFNNPPPLVYRPKMVSDQVVNNSEIIKDLEINHVHFINYFFLFRRNLEYPHQLQLLVKVLYYRKSETIDVADDETRCT